MMASLFNKKRYRFQTALSAATSTAATAATAIVTALAITASSLAYADDRDSDDDERKIVFIHTGDFHGELNAPVILSRIYS